MNQTVVRVNPPHRASAASVSTWLQLAKNYDAAGSPQLARRCRELADRLADMQATTAEVLEGILADIKALAAERAERWQAPRVRP